MTTYEIHMLLEQRGYIREPNGGGTEIFRKGNIVVSGTDGDLPQEGWWMIGVYTDWINNGSDIIWSMSDWTSEPDFADQGGPLDFAKALGLAEQAVAK